MLPFITDKDKSITLVLQGSLFLRGLVGTCEGTIITELITNCFADPNAMARGPPRVPDHSFTTVGG